MSPVGTRGKMHKLRRNAEGHLESYLEEGRMVAGYIFWGVNGKMPTPIYAHEDGGEREGGQFVSA